MVEYIVRHVSKDIPKNRRPGISMSPIYLTIHSTGNPNSTAINERDWLTSSDNKRTASWHIAVDESYAVEAIPLDEVAWHAGDGRNGTGNSQTIGLEICESGDREKTLRNAAKVSAKILKKYGWSTNEVYQHYDWSGKNCPRILRDTGRWEEFLGMIEEELKKDKSSKIVLWMDSDQAEVDGETFQLDTVPVIDEESGRALVPIRFVAEAMGAEVKWNESSRVVDIYLDNQHVALEVGTKRVAINNNVYEIDVASYISEDNRTMVPLRFVSEGLGFKVDYYPDDERVEIQRKEG